MSQQLLKRGGCGAAEDAEVRMGGVLGASEVSGIIIGAAMRVHTAVGPGLMESVYQVCLAHELRKRGRCVRVQVRVPIVYDGIEIDRGYTIDLLVDDAVVVELKAVAKLPPVHEAQLLSYLRLGRYQIGLLINFHVPHLRDGIKRMVNTC